MNFPGMPGGGGGGLGANTAAGMNDQEAAMVKAVSLSAAGAKKKESNVDQDGRCNPQWKAAQRKP